jgi:hypothetical protein
MSGDFIYLLQRTPCPDDITLTPSHIETYYRLTLLLLFLAWLPPSCVWSSIDGAMSDTPLITKYFVSYPRDLKFIILGNHCTLYYQLN